MQACSKCGLPRPRQCSGCGAEIRDASTILSEAAELEAGHGSQAGLTIHELYLMGDIPPVRKGQHQSAKTVMILQRYSRGIEELEELDSLVQGVQNSRKGRPNSLPLAAAALASAGSGLSSMRRRCVRVNKLTQAQQQKREATRAAADQVGWLSQTVAVVEVVTSVVVAGGVVTVVVIVERCGWGTIRVEIFVLYCYITGR